jgi:hypothetical protein
MCAGSWPLLLLLSRLLVPHRSCIWLAVRHCASGGPQIAVAGAEPCGCSGKHKAAGADCAQVPRRWTCL